MHIAIITAGGAGMFCGSCMHDNTWARALMAAGCEVSLVPTYTPIRVDEPDASERRVFFGGLNVYLDSKVPLWQRLPRPLTRWLDSPHLIRWASGLSISNDAAQLGRLMLDVLAGEQGPHATLGDELAGHIARDLRPDVVIFSNALQVGVLRRLRQSFPGPVLCVLQGDDVFLDGLPPPIREQAVALIAERAAEFDRFLVHSRFYRDYISRYLRLAVEKFRLLPLGIDLAGHDGKPGEHVGPPTVGYFARIAPEKGLHHLVQAFLRLHARCPEARLRVGGYLGPIHKRYFRDVMAAARPLGDAFEYVGSPDAHADKVRFYRSLDVLSVPTEFLEPKGLYVLEALANGVPVVQPRHGSFPELVEATGGGRLFTPRDFDEHAAQLDQLLGDRSLRISLGTTGQRNVRERYSGAALARETLRVLGE
jgi:glycosyltransferase involved in cell wall biosynthesis